MTKMRAQLEGQVEDLRQQLATSAPPEQRAELEAKLREYESLFEGYPAPDDLRLAGLTFEGELVLHGSMRSARVTAFGPGHSACDTVLWLPDERVLFTGDLVVSSGNLILALGTPELWPPVLDRLEELGAEWIVPGHGALVRAEEGLGKARSYLREIFRLADEAAAAGLTEADVDQLPVPPGWPAYWFRRNMRRLLGAPAE